MVEHHSGEIICRIANENIQFLIDSGSPINTITESDWTKLKCEWKEGKANLFNVIEHPRSNIKAYASENPLKIIALFSAWIEVVGYAKPRAFAQFMVVREASRALLSNATSQEMKLLKLGLEVNALSTESAKEFARIPNILIEFDINKDVTPSQITHYRVPLMLESAVNKRLDEMQRLGIIEKAPATSRWISPMEVVMKGESDFRITIDMRRPNKAIRRAYFPLPNIAHFHKDLHGAKFFTRLDAKSAFHHLKLHRNSREITTFMTSRGLMRFKRLLFGVNTAPEIWQRTMQELFRGCKGVLIFIDDFLIYGTTREELKQREKLAMDIIKANNLTLNLEKCVFETSSVEFLGYEINKDGIKPSKSKIEAVQNFKTPKTQTEVRSFLGIVTFLSPFIKDLATKTKPLRELTKKSSTFSWQKDQEDAFQEIKHYVIKDVMTQGFFKIGAETQVYTDASGVGLGAVLVQIHGSKKQIIAFAAKSLTEVEQRYPQTQREALAIVWAVEKWYYYLLGGKFTILTDHKALEYIYGGKLRDGNRAQKRQEAWALRLAAYNFKIKYIPGHENIADPLSRLRDLKDAPYVDDDRNQELCSIQLDLEELCFQERCNVTMSVEGATINAVQGETLAITINEIRKESEEDEDFKKIAAAMGNGNWSDVTGSYQAFQHELRWVDSILLRGERFVIPKTLRRKALEIAHLGHPGVVTMKRMLRQRVWWSGLDSDIDQHAKNCLVCARLAQNNRPEPMKMSQMPEKPWDFVAIDFYEAKELKKKVLVLTDYHTNYIQCKQLNATDTERTTEALEEIFKTFGYPARMKADNGPPFQGKDFETWCSKRGIKLVHSTPRRPQENGKVERVMPNITRSLAAALIESKSLKPALIEFQHIYNSRPHTTTLESPNDMMFNRSVRCRLPIWSDTHFTFDEETRDKNVISKFKTKIYGDKERRAEESEIKEGDDVMLRTDKRSKLDSNFDEAPHKVIKKTGGNLVLENVQGKTIERNVDQIKKRPTERETCEAETENNSSSTEQ